jgi:hypothetical protein
MIMQMKRAEKCKMDFVTSKPGNNEHNMWAGKQLSRPTSADAHEVPCVMHMWTKKNDL